MTDTNGGFGAPEPQQTAPALSVLVQYVKDFSFENPNAPSALAPNQGQPQIGIQINVTLAQLAPTDYEVTLQLEGKAERNNTVLFAFELAFAGIFRVQNLPSEHLQPVLMIECPRLLFPFAREIIATTIRNGGFAPLLLDPVDFVAIYQQRLAQQGGAQPAPAPS